MNRRKLLLIISIIALAGVSFLSFIQNRFITSAQAAGGLEITYLNLPLSGPIFNIQNFLPGDCVSREVVAKNASHKPIELKVRSEEETDNDNLATQVDWEIKSGSVLYTNILKNFYNQNQVSLGTLQPNQSKTFEFKACFKTTAGNEYQNTLTSFDLVFATKFGHTPPPNNLPSQCQHLNGKIDKFIIGDEENNHLVGGSKKEFIDGRGGNDRIEGWSDEDCLVGGDGNDRIDGGSGKDIILGGEGNDDLRGSSGDDRIYGMEGNDTLRGESGNDYLDGGAGIDTIFGSSGNDTCVSGENNNSCEL